MTWTELTTLVPEDWIASSFAVVRHPVTRLVSAYHHQALQLKSVPVGVGFATWFKGAMARRKRNPFLYDGHLIAQSNFVPKSATVFRFEDGLEHVFDYIESRFGTAAVAVEAPHLNRTRAKAKHRRETPFTEELTALVQKEYADDFERFGYDPLPDGDIVVNVPTSSASSVFSRKHARIVMKSLQARVFSAVAPYVMPPD